MNIFFSASLRAKDQFGVNHQTIIDTVKATGEKITVDPMYLQGPQPMPAKKQREALCADLLNQLKKADALIAEISFPSTTVGYLVHEMVQMNKPVVIFYSGDWELQVFRNLEENNEKFQLVRYENLNELKEEVRFAVDFMNSAQDVRFNFFVSPRISSYLDWVARNKKVPRSVFLRRLIEEDIKKES